jgi:hypothetical protein
MSLNNEQDKNLCELVMELIGKRDDSPEFQNFLRVVGEPSTVDKVGSMKSYSFYQLGLDFDYETVRQSFDSITFELDTAGIRSGEIQPYTHDLPVGIKLTDSCAEVERKLGVKPESSYWVEGCQSSHCDAKSRASDYWQHYQVPPYYFTFIFDSPEGGLHLLGVDLLVARKRNAT